jgi:hypothetical protein
MFQPVNILEELRKEQRNFPLDDALAILANDQLKEARIIDSIRKSNGNPQLLDASTEIFSLDALRKVCEEYRLRLLPSKYYKGDLPYEAIIRIKELERITGVELKEFKIMAPAKMFNLKDEYEDPVLLAPIGDDKFLFIHKWGNDLNWYRKLLYFPIRSFDTWLGTLLVFSLLLTAIVPWNWIVRDIGLYNESAFYYRAMLFGSCITWLFVITFYFGFVSRKNFSRVDWDNPYFNK